MTKIDLSQCKPIPGFDSLKWKQERHAQILKETEGMTREEIRERFRQASERATLRRKERQARVEKKLEIKSDLSHSSFHTKKKSEPAMT